MKRTIAAAFLLAFIVSPLQLGYASPRTNLQSNDRPTIVLKLSDLRSAYLQRAGIVRYDQANLSSEGLRQQLQRHFEVVLGVLLVSTPKSIDIALARLEASGDHQWSASERANRRQQLLSTRYLQMQRLAAYRDRGQFPLNEGQASSAVPIFVDQHDTACAVGQLMRWDGWLNEVASIQDTNNLVYVPDARRSAVTDWALTSGLTSEEAALIQPAYSWPAEYDAANYEPGELAIEKNGLRFRNFQLQAANYIATPSSIPPDICRIVPTVCMPTLTPTGGAVPVLQGLGLLTGQGQYGGLSSYPAHTPNGTNWIAIAGNLFSSPQPALHDLNATADEGRAQSIVIRFDVSTVASDKWINGMAESSYLYQSGFADPLSFNAPDATYYLKTILRDGATTIDTLLIDQATTPIGYQQKLDISQFSPRQKISVESQIYLQDGVSIDTYLLDFNLVTVPEPASGLAAIAGLFVFGAVARCRRES